MSPILDLLRSSASVRRFFAAYLQSSLGTGMGYVALVLVALERFHSSWAVALVLIADLVPLMAIGSVLGGAADRLPRRACAITGDVVRAGAFLGIAFSGNLVVVVAFAALAGLGNGIFYPAALAGLPHLAGERHAPAATSLFGALSMLGKTLGPVVAAGVLLAGGVDVALAANGVSFALSALLLLSVDLGRAPAAEPGEAPPEKTSLRAIGGFGRVVVVASSAALFAGMSNVAEPRFITHDLAGSSASFSLMVAVWGIGVVIGSLAGGRGGEDARLWRRYLAGLAAIGAGYAAAAAAPVYLLTLPGFALCGLGNGAVIVHERLLVLSLVPQRAQGRAFGTLEMVASWALAGAFGLGALAVAGPGARWTLLIAGLGTLAAWGACAVRAPARREPAVQQL
jgi:MFS family permease